MKYTIGKNPNSRNGFKKGYHPSEETRKDTILVKKQEKRIPFQSEILFGIEQNEEAHD